MENKLLEVQENITKIFEEFKDEKNIEELKDSNIKNYKIKTKEEILFPLIENNDVMVVAGSFFGDEGKGKTVDAVANHEKIKYVARVNSGENAGHTVYFKGIKFIFHLAPSGLFSGCDNGIGPNCVMDPVSFMETEIQQLVNEKVNYSNLGIGNVLIVTPYDKIIDALGRANSSTLKGMSPAHSSKVRKKGLRMDDLFMSEKHQRKIIENEMEMYHALLKEKGISKEDILNQFEKLNSDGNERIPKHLINFLKSEDEVKFVIDLYKKYVINNSQFPKRENVTSRIQKELELGNKVLLEGPQSFFLANNIETHWRSSTSADTTSSGIKAAANYNIDKYRSVTINVHKTPGSSRVGNGANTSGFIKQDFFSKQKINTLDELNNICEDYDNIQKNILKQLVQMEF